MRHIDGWRVDLWPKVNFGRDFSILSQKWTTRVTKLRKTVAGLLTTDLALVKALASFVLRARFDASPSSAFLLFRSCVVPRVSATSGGQDSGLRNLNLKKVMSLP